MGDMIYCEFLKLKRSKVKLIGLLGSLAVPILSVALSITNRYLHPENKLSLFQLYDDTFVFLMLLFGPLIFTIITVYLFNREYSEKTLKTILAVPVSKSRFLVSKFIVLFLFILILVWIIWAEILVLGLVCNLFYEVVDLSIFTAMKFFIQITFGGILIYMTLTPFVYLAILTKGYLVPFIVISFVVLINVVLSASSIAGYYPWAATYLILTGRMENTVCPAPVSVLILVLVFVFGIAASMIRFLREDIAE